MPKYMSVATKNSEKQRYEQVSKTKNFSKWKITRQYIRLRMKF